MQVSDYSAMFSFRTGDVDPGLLSIDDHECQLLPTTRMIMTEANAEALVLSKWTWWSRLTYRFERRVGMDIDLGGEG